MEIGKEVKQIKLSDIEISSDNVRKAFDPDDPQVIELAKSIKEFGQLQPVVLIGDKPKYELIVGQRRYHALKHLGISEIKAIFLLSQRPLSSVQATMVSLSENLHRVQLSYNDMVTAITKLYDHYKDAKKVSQVIGVSVQTVYEYLKVDKMITPKIRTLLNKRKITKDDVKRAFVIAKGNITEMEEVVKEMDNMTTFQKNRAVNARRSDPKKSTKTILKKSRQSSFTDVLTLNLSSEIELALKQAKKELQEERETIALNAIRIWLTDNKFLK